MKRKMLVAIASLALFLVAVPPAPADVISYSNFSDTTGLTLNGGALTVDNKLEMTATNISGSAFYTTPLTLSNYAFATTFTFSLNGYDGITFCLQQAASGAGALGADSGWLGYGGIRPSIAVEFDTWQNPGEPSADHVAIVKNGYLLDGVDHLAYASASLNNAGLLTAWVEYDGSILRIYLSSSTTKPTTPIIEYAIALSGIFAGSDVYAGFTGGTSIFSDGDQYIHAWTFNTNPVPLPASVLLLGTGLLGLAGWRRFRKN